MTTTIVLTCDTAEDALDVIAAVLCNNGDRTRLVALGDYIEPDVDLDDENVAVEADPTPAYGTERPVWEPDMRPINEQVIDTVDCPWPGCPGRPGHHCGSPSQGYGTRYVHAARRLEWGLRPYTP